jgi:ribonuclease J
MVAFQIGSFTITALPVDHSAFDAVAYSIQCEGKHLLYTGDLRAHGRKPGMLRQLKSFCKEHPVDLLVTEGTRIGQTPTPSTKETEVESQMRQIYADAPGLVLNWFSPLNLDRWVSAFRALDHGRYFLHDLYTEFVHYLIKSQVPSIPLERESQRLRVYCPPSQRKKLHYKGIEGFIQRTKTCLEFDLTEAINPAERCVMLFRPSMFKHEFRDGFPKGTELIVSLWPGYTESEDFKQVKAAIESNGGKIHNAHASGHIYPEDLTALIKEINPEKIIPVHTEHPQDFLKKFPQTILLQDGESFHF